MDILKNNLLAFFELFKDKPNLMVEYILENDILTDKTKKFFIGNDQLRNFTKDDKKPFFRNFDELKDYYDKFFINNGKIVNRVNINSIFNIEILKEELREAIKIEDYERAFIIQKKLKKISK